MEPTEGSDWVDKSFFRYPTSEFEVEFSVAWNGSKYYELLSMEIRWKKPTDMINKSYFRDCGDLVLRDRPAWELFVDALEDLVADVDHLGSAEGRVLHAHVHALGCWKEKQIIFGSQGFKLRELDCGLLPRRGSMMLWHFWNQELI